MGGVSLVLASGSPRRRRLLEEAGIPFRIVVPDVEESGGESGDPHKVAVDNATRKAAAVEGEAVLAADTVVALGDRLLGKPADAAEAREMLSALSGTVHRVVTGVVVRARGGTRSASVETRVTMRPLSTEEIDAYVRSGESMGKAGAYAIQETGDRFVTGIDGPYDNVVGLPVETVRRLLSELRIEWAG